MIPAMLAAYWLMVRRGETVAALAGFDRSMRGRGGVLHGRAIRSANRSNSAVFIDKARLSRRVVGRSYEVQPRIWIFEVAEIVWPGSALHDQNVLFDSHSSTCRWRWKAWPSWRRSCWCLLRKNWG